MAKRHGFHGTLTYGRWKSMISRCHNPNASNYRYYGGKGIFVCERWRTFTQFLADMGECPDRTMTLDRRDNARGYEPGNCQWATMATQNRNRTYCIQLTHNGATKILVDWACAIGIPANVLAMRIRAGWDTERALTQPLRKRRQFSVEAKP